MMENTDLERKVREQLSYRRLVDGTLHKAVNRTTLHQKVRES